MKVRCIRGVEEDEFSIVPILHVFRTDHPQCEGCVANFKGKCTTNTVLIDCEGVVAK